MDFQSRLAERAHRIRASKIRELQPYLSIPEMISFGGGYPDPDTFAVQEVTIAFSTGNVGCITEDTVDTALQYGPTSGNQRLLHSLLSWHNERDAVSLHEGNCAILNGSQEGLFILSFLFLESDDSVVIAEPAYPGIVMACSPFTRNVITVGLDDEGMCIHQLTGILTERRRKGMRSPKFIYTVPSGHNPSGVTLSSERRRELITIAEEFDTLIIEDDPYRLISLDDGVQNATIQSLEKSARRVIRLDSFSKVFAPGLRLGYATGHPDIVRLMLLLKQSINLQTGMLVQAFIDEYFNTHSAEEINEAIIKNCHIYRKNRDRMIEMARQLLPGDMRYTIPTHGFFIWFQMPGIQFRADDT